MMGYLIIMCTLCLLLFVFHIVLNILLYIRRKRDENPKIDSYTLKRNFIVQIVLGSIFIVAFILLLLFFLRKL